MVNENIYTYTQKAIRQLLNTNITDPNLLRPVGQQWITIDKPQEFKNFPIVSITKVSDRNQEFSVGEVGIAPGVKARMHYFVLQLSIWTRWKEIHSGMSDGLLVDDIAGKIVNVLQSQREYLKTTYGIVDVIQRGVTNLPIEQDTRLLQCAMTWELEFVHQRT